MDNQPRMPGTVEVPSADCSDYLLNISENEVSKTSDIGLLHTPTNCGAAQDFSPIHRSPTDKNKKPVHWAGNNSDSEKRSGSYSQLRYEEKVLTPDL